MRTLMENLYLELFTRPDLRDKEGWLLPGGEGAVNSALENIEQSHFQKPGRNIAVFKAKFGLDGTHYESNAAIGKDFNISRERVRQIYSVVIRHLRHPKYGLKKFLPVEQIIE